MIGEAPRARYAAAMDAHRPADPDEFPLPINDNVIYAPITDADWAAMTHAERAAIEAAIGQFDRGEGIPHVDMIAEQRRIRRNRVR